VNKRKAVKIHEMTKQAKEGAAAFTTLCKLILGA
jgi:hypothetical protein